MAQAVEREERLVVGQRANREARLGPCAFVRGNLDVQHLFSGGERLTQPMFNLSAGGRLTRAADASASSTDAPNCTSRSAI